MLNAYEVSVEQPAHLPGYTLAMQVPAFPPVLGGQSPLYPLSATLVHVHPCYIVFKRVGSSSRASCALCVLWIRLSF